MYVSWQIAPIRIRADNKNHTREMFTSFCLLYLCSLATQNENNGVSHHGKCPVPVLHAFNHMTPVTNYLQNWLASTHVDQGAYLSVNERGQYYWACAHC